MKKRLTRRQLRRMILKEVHIIREEKSREDLLEQLASDIDSELGNILKTYDKYLDTTERWATKKKVQSILNDAPRDFLKGRLDDLRKQAQEALNTGGA